MAQAGDGGKPLFRDLDPDEPEPESVEIESLCVNCGENGTTRVMLTKIPYYKEHIIMSFDCDHCGFSNNEVQFGGQTEEKGVRITLNVRGPDDMNRQVVKSDYTCVKIPHIDFEIQAQSQKGEVTTVEGVLSRSIAGLEQDQEQRKVQHPEDAKKIDDFIQVLNELKTGAKPFTMVFEDISGNCFVENPLAPKADLNCETEHFIRTVEQDHVLGIYRKEEISSDKVPEKSDINESVFHASEELTKLNLQSEVMAFATNCPECGSPCNTNMKLTQIPYFKEVVIMATNCESCGHRTNEVKSAGGIEEKGVKIQVKIRGRDDFSRDILKSDTCSLTIPELEFEAGSHTLSGKFTTVEGLLKDMKEGLEKGGALFGIFNDTRTDSSSGAIRTCVGRMERVLNGEESITLILDDPAGNSYVQVLTDDPNEDDGVKLEHYERSFDQNEELGLNDMKTENYEEDIAL